MAWMKSFSSATFHLNKTNPPCNQVFLTHPKHSSSPVDLGHFCLFFIIACKSDSLRAWSLKIELEARRNQQILKVSKALARRNAPLRCSRKSPCHGLFRVLHNQAFSKTQTRQLVIFSITLRLLWAAVYFSHIYGPNVRVSCRTRKHNTILTDWIDRKLNAQRLDKTYEMVPFHRFFHHPLFYPGFLYLPENKKKMTVCKLRRNLSCLACKELNQKETKSG